MAGYYAGYIIGTLFVPRLIRNVGHVRCFAAFAALAAILISLGVVPIAITRVTEPRIELIVPVQLSELARISPLGMVGALSSGIVNGAFWGMAPVFGQRLDLSDGDIALLMSSTILGGVLLQWPIGHLSDRVDRRTVLILTSFATAAASGTITYITVHGYPGLIPIAFLYGGLMFTLYSISVAHTNDHLGAGQVLEATRGLLLVFGIGALCGPILGGLAMRILGPAGLPAMSAITAAGLALFGVFRITQRAAPAVEEQADFVPMVRTSPVALEMHPEADQAPELDLTDQIPK